jgi:phosphomannomutase/phosphoglucomutase
MIEEHDFLHGKGSISRCKVKEEYLEEVGGIIGLRRPMRVVVDAGNGVAGLFAPELLRRIGCEVTELHCESDGTFPNHPPNPENPANMRELREKVAAIGADIGFAYDGDGDRLGVVDERGERYNADSILILLSRDFLSRHAGDRVLVDVKSSNLVIKDITRHGGVPVIWKTGHSLIKRKMHDDYIKLAGEFSGHMFMAEGYYPIDDAMLASCRLAEYLSRQDLPLSQLLGELPERYSTDTIELACPDDEKFWVVSEVTKYFSESCDVLDIDGARIMFDGGWALVRASNTSPNLTLRFEANTEERLAEIQSIIYKKLIEFPAVILPTQVS